MKKEQNQAENYIKVYYKSQFHVNYKIDEKVIKEIINRGVDSNMKLKLIIYYKNCKISNLIIKNDQTNSSDKLKSTNVVYKFNISEGSTPQLNHTYIGMTTTTLSRRLTMHLQDGAIKRYFLVNGYSLNREALVNNTIILMRCNNKKSLEVAESIFIGEFKPNINVQSKNMGGVLKLYS